MVQTRTLTPGPLFSFLFFYHGCPVSCPPFPSLHRVSLLSVFLRREDTARERWDANSGTSSPLEVSRTVLSVVFSIGVVLFYSIFLGQSLSPVLFSFILETIRHSQLCPKRWSYHSPPLSAYILTASPSGAVIQISSPLVHTPWASPGLQASTSLHVPSSRATAIIKTLFYSAHATGCPS